MQQHTKWQTASETLPGWIKARLRNPWDCWTSREAKTWKVTRRKYGEMKKKKHDYHYKKITCATVLKGVFLIQKVLISHKNYQLCLVWCAEWLMVELKTQKVGFPLSCCCKATTPGFKKEKSQPKTFLFINHLGTQMFHCSQNKRIRSERHQQMVYRAVKHAEIPEWQHINN